MVDILIAVIVVLFIYVLVMLNNRIVTLEYKMNRTYELLKIMNK